MQKTTMESRLIHQFNPGDSKFTSENTVGQPMVVDEQSYSRPNIDQNG